VGQERCASPPRRGGGIRGRRRPPPLRGGEFLRARDPRVALRSTRGYLPAGPPGLRNGTARAERRALTSRLDKATRRDSLRAVSRPLFKTWTAIVFVLAAYPLFLIVALGAFAVVTSALVGHWPSYNNPDPKTIWWSYPQMILLLGYVTSPFVGLIPFFAALHRPWKLRDLETWALFLVIAISWSVGIAYQHFDPGGLVAWLLG
jgi:hypothetical protein